MVICFSGIGNSKYIADRIAASLQEKLLCMNERIKSGNTGSVKTGENLIVVVPTYAWRIPRVVSDWIGQTEFVGAKNVWYVMSCGSGIGGADIYNRKLSEKKGIKHMGTAQIIMPESKNNISGYPRKGQTNAKIIDYRRLINAVYVLLRESSKSILFAKTEEEKEKYYEQILHTSDGKYTNAMFTMLRTLLGIYKKVKPEYVAFVFDKTRDTFRRTELGADFYKANRKETAKPLKEQFIQMEEFLQEIGCAVFMSDDYEADDYAASLVEKFEGPDLQTYVLTKDHDYFQVVSEYTRMWRVVNKDKLEQLKKDYGFFGSDVYESLPANVFEYTPEIVYAEEGVYPQQIPVLLAITGDPGDGIPGCKGVSSAAAPLVDEYKSLDEIYAAIDDCEGVAKKEKELNGFWKEYLGIGRSPLKALKTNREMVYLSEKLATMKRDIEISCGIEDLKLRVDIEKLKEELGRYEMFSLIKEVENL